MSEEIGSKVKSIICQQLQITIEECSDGTSFVDDLQADSLDVVELVLALEEEFKIEIPDEDAEGIRTVKDAVKKKKKHLPQ